MSSFTTFLWNILATAIFLVVWDQLVVDKTISIKAWTFTVEPIVPRAVRLGLTSSTPTLTDSRIYCSQTPNLISKLVVVSSPASPKTRSSCIVPLHRSHEPVVESIDISGTILSNPLAEYELERRLLRSLAVTAHATPQISNPSIYFKMSYQAEQTRQGLKQAVAEKLSC